MVNRNNNPGLRRDIESVGPAGNDGPAVPWQDACLHQSIEHELTTARGHIVRIAALVTLQPTEPEPRPIERAKLGGAGEDGDRIGPPVLQRGVGAASATDFGCSQQFIKSRQRPGNPERWHVWPALAIALLASSCALDVPPEGGYQIAGQSAAVEFVARFHGIPNAADPIYFIAPDVQCGGAEIFIHGGTGCVGGAWLRGTGDWNVVAPGETLYSQGTLCHEVLHMAVDDDGHTRPELWGTHDDHYQGGRVAECRAALAAHPDIDAMGVRL